MTIEIDPTEVLLHFQSPSGPALVFHGFPNDAGYLAKLKSDPFPRIKQGGEAEKNRASTAMRSLLSNLSAQLDIPLIIELVEVTELATGTKGITFTAPFPVTGLAVNARENPNDRELRHHDVAQKLPGGCELTNEIRRGFSAASRKILTVADTVAGAGLDASLRRLACGFPKSLKKIRAYKHSELQPICPIRDYESPATGRFLEG